MSPIQFLTIKMICDLTGYSKSTVHRKVHDKSFPPPMKIGKRASRWPLPVYNAWASMQMPDASYEPWISEGQDQGADSERALNGGRNV